VKAKLSLMNNLDTSIRFFGNFLLKYLRKYPNPNNIIGLDLCERKDLIVISNSSHNTTHIMNAISDKSPLLPKIIVEVKGDIKFDFKSKIEAKLLNPLEVMDVDTKEKIILYGKNSDYRSSFLLHIVTRELVSARELAYYITELLFDSSLIKYPAYIKDIDKNEIYAEIKDFGSFKITNNEISFVEDLLEESNIYRLTCTIDIRDTIYLYSNFT